MLLIRVFAWNCRGAGAVKFTRVLREYIWDVRPDVIIILEPRISGNIADKVVKSFGNSHA